MKMILIHRKYKRRCDEWIKNNIGKEYINEFWDKYEKINQGIPIGGFEETAIFLRLVDHMIKEAK